MTASWQRDLLATLVVLAAPGAAVAAATVEGTVHSASGTLVEGARVEVVEGEDAGAVAVTDRRGGFVLEEVTPPVLLLVSHPRFEDAATEVTGGEPVSVRLEPRQTVYEEIVVSATRGGDTFQPVSIASTVVEPEEVIASPSTLKEVVDNVPGVAENGQAGIFQVFSIRGISRHRILTLISGMQITSERRAGVSASFVDPQLMGTVDLLRGPASSYYGSGALGGVVQVFPREWESLHIKAGYDAAGDERYGLVGWGEPGPEGFSLALAHRRAGDAEAPDGSTINSHFEQASATLARRFRGGGLDWKLLAIPTVGRDIGKANTDFPERTTEYPEENHLLVKLAAQSAAGLDLSLWGHAHELETETVEVGGGRDTVSNRTFDFGGHVERELDLGQRTSARAGTDYFGRRGVDAVEREVHRGSPDVVSRTLDGGEQDEAAAFASVRHRFGRGTVEAGGRFTWLRQANADEGSLDRSAWNGFVGAVVPFGGGFELSANLGTGLRFPNLSERFFTGTTGRGEIIANRDLDPERSVNADLRLRWYGSRLFLEADIFRNRIDDYIERIELRPDALTFVNLTSGTLEGLEFEGSYDLPSAWRLAWGGQSIEGKDDSGRPLADVPPDRLFLELRRGFGADGRLSWSTRLELRDERTEVGSGERPIPSATLVSAGLGLRLTPELTVRLKGSNLLDESYFSSADDKAPLAPGRSLGLGLEWRP